jgi:uncharacterized protein (TIGR01777 family)
MALKLLVTGGTGFIGRALVGALVTRGDEVTVLTRGADRQDGRARYAHWNPLENDAWFPLVEDQDAVVHLAGEQAVGVRYTEAVKRRLSDSRVATGRRLVEAVARAAARPRALISASGVGYYGGTLEHVFVDETSPPGGDFLARLCVDWEAATEPAAALGLRVVHARTAPVLGRGGGALETMTLPFKLFAGGWIASGRQGFSWVHLDDAIAILLRAIDEPDLSGKVNVASPHPVSNKELSKAIGRTLHRPCWLPVPELALKTLFGEGAEPLVTGQWALPKVMQRRGYAFRYPQIEAALEQALAAPG